MLREETQYSFNIIRKQVSRLSSFHQLFTSISVANQAKGCVGVGGYTWAVSMDPSVSTDVGYRSTKQHSNNQQSS